MFEMIPVVTESDLFLACRRTRQLAQAQFMNKILVEKLVTAVSELARNQLIHARGGAIYLEALEGGIRVEARDSGPGIADLEQAMSESWSSVGGLGLGLPSARDLVHEFEIESKPGEGTVIRLTQWVRSGALAD